MKSSFITTLLFAAVLLTVSSCKKEADKTPYTCTTCVTTPEALAANNTSSKGVYKGVVIGSSGTIKFSVQNGGTDIIATMVIDGITVDLVSSIEWIDGQAYVAPFTGIMNSQPVSITFSVQADGSNPIITSANIPGHPNAIFTMAKETSDALIEGYEGNYNTTRPETGTFNIILSRAVGKFGGYAREDGSTDKSDVNGTIVNGVIMDEDGHPMGTLSGDEIKGTFQDGSGNTVNIEAVRTL